MTKTEIISSIQGKMMGETPKTAIKDMLTALTEVVTESLSSGEDVRLHNLGTLKAVRRDSRKGRNPSTGEAITIPEKMVVKFKPAPLLTRSTQSLL